MKPRAGSSYRAALLSQRIEAGWVERTVIVEFESVERAKAAYETDAYREALAAMADGVERDFRILEGV